MNAENITRKKQIRTAAIDLIAEKGIQNVTMKNLSRLIGISEPAIYRYYNSKYDILYGILDSFEEYSIGKIKAIQKQMNHPLQQMEAFFMNRCQLCQGAPNVAKVVFSEEYFQHDERLAEKMSSIMHQHGTFFYSAIQNCQKQGIFRSDIDAKIVFQIIIGPLRLLIKQWGLEQHRFSLLEAARKLWESEMKLFLVSHNR
ncbi:MAG: TetR/AcrR family transcriptional regulator [Caldisericia bacterium]|nr:TetR/AcrR family transcriptional regulator [Caldisericia bacterium]